MMKPKGPLSEWIESRGKKRILPFVIQTPAPAQTIEFTIRLSEPEIPEDMSAASIIALAADSWDLPLPSAFRSPSVLDQLQQQMKKAKEDGTKMIRVTSALGPSERLIDPG